ncbi:MAG: DUF4436 family protein [Leptospira sp.]|nr:DUF4436 family protein [Leptospira sp.]
MKSINRLLISNRFQFLILLLIIIGASYLASVRYFIKDKEDVAIFTDVDVDQVKTSMIFAEVKSIDLEKREAKVELRINLAIEYGYKNRIDTPKEDLRLISFSSNEDFVFKARQPIRKTLITLPIVGSNSDYPFDEYESILSLGFFKNSKYFEEKVEVESKEGIPIVLNMKSPISNYKIEFYEKTVEDFWLDRFNGNPDRIIKVIRTKSSKFYSIFIILGMVALSLLLVFITIRTLLYNRLVQINFLVFIGILLLVLPALRNTQPGIPTLGVLSDYLSFFWVEGLATVTLIILTLKWHFQKEKYLE